MISLSLQYPKQICTKDAEKNLKEAAELRKDNKLLLTIKGVDLLAKEFKNHEKCYRDYTRIIYQNENKCTVYEKGDFKAVCDIIDREVISLSKAISMDVIIDVYGIGTDQHQYRQYLKERILKCYGEKIYFVRPEYVIISKQCISEKCLSSRVQFSSNSILKQAADILYRSVKEKIASAESLSWPPTVEELTKREPTKELIDFLRNVIIGGDSHHSAREKKSRVIQSLADDIMYHISHGICDT